MSALDAVAIFAATFLSIASFAAMLDWAMPTLLALAGWIQ